MQREVQITVKENTYTVKYPNVGQLLDIETLKATLSNGLYGAIKTSLTVDSSFALDVVDIEAYLTVLCPDLLKDLKSKNLKELDIQDFIEVRNAFTKQLLPFIQQWREIINQIGKEESDVK